MISILDSETAESTTPSSDEISPAENQGFGFEAPSGGFSEDVLRHIAERAWAVNERVKSAHERLMQAALEIGQLLTIVRDDRLYEYLNYSSMDNYIASTGIGRRSAYRYMKIVDDLMPVQPKAEQPTVAMSDLIAIGVTKSEMIATVAAEHPERLPELVSDAKALAPADLRQHLQSKGVAAPLERQEWLTEVGYRISAKATKLGLDTDPVSLLREIQQIAHETILNIKQEK